MTLNEEVQKSCFRLRSLAGFLATFGLVTKIIIAYLCSFSLRWPPRLSETPPCQLEQGYTKTTLKVIATFFFIVI